MPKVTIVIPTYNRQDYLAAAVESALRQTYDDREVLVVDDGSTDRTPELLAGYGREIRIIRQKNRGAPAALNAGIRAARGDWVAWLSSDDLFEPDKLERQMAHVADHPDVCVIYTDWYAIDASGVVTATISSPAYAAPAELQAALFGGCFINGSTTLVRRAVYLRAGLFDTRLPQAHDWDIWLRLARDYPFGHIAAPLIRYRWHGKNMSAGPEALAYNERVLVKAHKYYRCQRRERL